MTMFACTALERPIEYQNQMERMKSDPAFPIGPVTTVGQITPGSTTTTTTTSSNHSMAHRAKSLPDTGSLSRLPNVSNYRYFLYTCCNSGD